jgi:hypothetical protein
MSECARSGGSEQRFLRAGVAQARNAALENSIVDLAAEPVRGVLEFGVRPVGLHDVVDVDQPSHAMAKGSYGPAAIYVRPKIGAEIAMWGAHDDLTRRSRRLQLQCGHTLQTTEICDFRQNVPPIAQYNRALGMLPKILASPNAPNGVPVRRLVRDRRYAAFTMIFPVMCGCNPQKYSITPT